MTQVAHADMAAQITQNTIPTANPDTATAGENESWSESHARSMRASLAAGGSVGMLVRIRAEAIC